MVARCGLCLGRRGSAPDLLVANRKKWLDWSLEHVNWTEDQWACVLWLNEVKRNLFGPDGPQWVIVGKNEGLTSKRFQGTAQVAEERSWCGAVWLLEALVSFTVLKQTSKRESTSIFAGGEWLQL
jgi:hypothetical protein